MGLILVLVQEEAICCPIELLEIRAANAMGLSWGLPIQTH